MKIKNLSIVPYILLLTFVVCIYGQSIFFGYVWDDNTLFVENTLLREGIFSWQAVARPILPDSSYFRPLVLFTWLLEMRWFGLNPIYSHAINTLIHACSVCLIFHLTIQVFNGAAYVKSRGIIAAFLYAAHPCLVESVAWVSGRFDLMATMLTLSACVVVMASKDQVTKIISVRVLAVFILTMLAMASKETGILFPGLCLLLVMASNSTKPAFFKGIKNSINKTSPFLAAYLCAAVVYFITRKIALGFASYSEFGGPNLLEIFNDSIKWARTLSFYTFLSVFPFGSITPRHDWSLEINSWRQNSFVVVTSILVFLGVIWQAFKGQSWAKLLLGFYLGLLPVMGFVPIMNGETIGSERFLSLPLAPFSIAVATLLMEGWGKFSSRMRSSEKFLCGALAVICLSVMSFVTYTIASMWESSLRLWSWQYSINPDNNIIRTNYLYSLSKESNPVAKQKFTAEIEAIRSRYGGQLPLDVQTVYAIYLLLEHDPEALKYYEGLEKHAGQIWKKIHGDDLRSTFAYTHVGTLMNYSQALIIFNGDLVQARKKLDEAQSIAPKGSEFNIAHQMVALLYLEGDTYAARKYYVESRQQLKAFNLAKLHASMKTLVGQYCVVKKLGHCESYVDEFENLVLQP
ncbi:MULTISPECIES: hypothetical protein [unclassified Acidovorax]|uniref:hypothetical protein n=1 Tax=unclassified Acidovorax TaxID=2684926 RepID=UPI0028831AA2|nr:MULTISPECIES: hypothetical protein [unclassified Acidovorax]